MRRFMKRQIKLSIIYISLISILCIIPVDKVKASENMYTSSYSEEYVQVLREYDTKAVMYITLLDVDTGEVCADIKVTLGFEYADGSWVKVNNMYLNIDCYEGYLVDVDKDTELHNEYGVRYCTITKDNGLSVKYALKAYADCYGDTSVDCEVIDIY